MLMPKHTGATAPLSVASKPASASARRVSTNERSHILIQSYPDDISETRTTMRHSSFRCSLDNSTQHVSIESAEYRPVSRSTCAYLPVDQRVTGSSPVSGAQSPQG